MTEIVPYKEPQTKDCDPLWLVGRMEWREHQVPLLSFEALLDGTYPEPNPRARIVVLKALGKSPNLRYLALLARSIPRLVTVQGPSIDPAPDHELTSPWVLQRVLVHGEPAVIPDLDALERMVVTSSYMHYSN
jgi:Chemotaxis signal transduction protein